MQPEDSVEEESFVRHAQAECLQSNFQEEFPSHGTSEHDARRNHLMTNRQHLLPMNLAQQGILLNLK